jgi:hypothetical protein
MHSMVVCSSNFGSLKRMLIHSISADEEISGLGAASKVNADRQLKREKPYKLSDGGGLHILIGADGAKYWRLAYRFLGKQKTLALGIYPTVPDEAKKWLAKGLDPSQVRKEQKLAALAVPGEGNTSGLWPAAERSSVKTSIA